MDVNDWRYEPERMILRESCLKVLFHRFGSLLREDGEPLHSSGRMYECAHDWVSAGNKTTSGLLKYFKAYYSDESTSQRPRQDGVL